MNVEDVEKLVGQKHFKYLLEVETAAQEVLGLNSSIKELSKASDELRLGLRALEQTSQRKTMINVGEMYVELPVRVCKNIIREDQENVSRELEKSRGDLKVTVNKLRDLEKLDELHGYNLKPLSAGEVSAMKKGFGLG